jgi:phosphate-selective porin OprO and OprP
MRWPGRAVLAIGLGSAAAGWAADPVEVLPPVSLTVEDAPTAPAVDAKATEPKPKEPAAEPQAPKPDRDVDRKPTVQLRGRFEADALGVTQSLANRLTIGDLESATGFRRARIGAQGTYGEQLRWVAEFDFADGDVRFDDVYAGLSGLPVPGELRVGHFWEPFGLEGQIGSNHFPFLERSPAIALDPGLNWGVALFAHTPDQTATFAAGIFRAGSDRVGRQQSEDPGLAYTARATWLAYHHGTDDPDTLVHVGAAASRRSPPDGVVAFQPDPQSTLLQAGESPLPPFIQGVTIPSQHVWLANLEMATAAGPAWAMAEWRIAAIDQTDAGGLTFWGWYLSAGYFLTGEHRRYDRARGTFDGVRVINPVYRLDDAAGCAPCGWGAWELVARVAYLDLADPDLPRAPNGLPAGAEAWTFTAGVNWYLTDFARLMLDCTQFRTRPPVGRWSGGTLFGGRFAVFW